MKVYLPQLEAHHEKTDLTPSCRARRHRRRHRRASALRACDCPCQGWPPFDIVFRDSSGYDGIFAGTVEKSGTILILKCQKLPQTIDRLTLMWYNADVRDPILQSAEKPVEWEPARQALGTPAQVRYGSAYDARSSPVGVPKERRGALCPPPFFGDGGVFRVTVSRKIAKYAFFRGIPIDFSKKVCYNE